MRTQVWLMLTCLSGALFCLSQGAHLKGAEWAEHLAIAAPTRLAEKNIVLFITDDESKTLGCYGDLVASTPNIDALAKDGIIFNNAFATTASCSASRSVVLSGLHNHFNGQYGHAHHFHKFESYANVVALSLPRVLANCGYRTARIGKFHVAPEDVYHFETRLDADQRNPVLMAETCREFISDANDERPFFLYFATADPHRSGKNNQRSKLELKPDLFGNKPDGSVRAGISEKSYDPSQVPVPTFLPDTPETREELAEYYQSVSRIDQGLGRLIEILKAADVYDKTMIVFTSDHGMAFAGAKTTVYEPGLAVPFVVRDPYSGSRGVRTDALTSHIDITPTLLDYANGLNRKNNSPKAWQNPEELWKQERRRLTENRAGSNTFHAYQGKSWLHLLNDPSQEHHETIFGSHTFHEIQMYYPMRSVRDHKFKLIWNIAHPLDFPFASDLWIASSWQAQFQKGPSANYGRKTVERYLKRPRFELYDMVLDPEESRNLADDPQFASVLSQYKHKLKEQQQKTKDPWITKWDFE